MEGFQAPQTPSKAVQRGYGKNPVVWLGATGRIQLFLTITAH